MESKVPLSGPGRFQWNMGGWFGGQLGGTVWMLVGVVVLVPQAPEVAGVWLVCFAVANAIGSGLWWHRDRIRPYPALQALLFATGFHGLIALAALHVLRPGLRITRPKGVLLADDPRIIAFLLIMIVALMMFCFLAERSARKERSRAPGKTSP